jgi:hypothetical protein
MRTALKSPRDFAIAKRTVRMAPPTLIASLTDLQRDFPTIRITKRRPLINSTNKSRTLSSYLSP